jgi:uncharacterized 2Fe-2S/4Fe-4S cluster protein (DUF4445 family)
MPEVKFIDENIVVEVEEGTRLIDCIRKAGYKAETPCSCIGICGKCKVIAFGELSPKTKEEVSHTGESDIRLACMAKVQGKAEVKFFNKENVLKTINRGFSIDVKVDSSIKKAKLPALGAAVDIGTTGISVYLVDLESGKVLNRISALNPQTEYGSDVLSRITYAIKEEMGVDILSKCIRDKINNMIKELVYKSYSLEDIYKVVISANTTMLHLFLGVNPESIAKAPYRAVFLDKEDFKALDLGIKINKKGILTVLPSVSAYVGADILSGIIAVDFQNRKCSSIFIDIGTNGEIVAIKDGKMAASSTAAGPALEGMNISCGSRAEEGAIDSLHIDEEYNITYTTIGNKKAKGICGSGLLDLAANLVNKNIVLKSGRFNKTLPEKLAAKLIDKRFYITEEIFISQNDIRQIQLAKAAIASGIIMLLKEIGIDIMDIEEVVIAGAFGYHLNKESIKTIGLIPQGFKGKISFVGNSSVEGARIALISEEKLKEMSEVRNNIKVVELSIKEEFQDYFVKELSF